MRIGITGGLGFIGRSLGLALAADGHDVCLTDVRQPAADLPGVSYRCASVMSTDECRATCAGRDVIVHTVAMHDAKQVENDPLLAVEVNVQGTLNLLRAAVEAGVSRFVYLSSAKVFGDPEQLPSRESDLPVPRETYALSKYICEEYCRKFHEQYGLEVVILRPYSVYGPGQALGIGYIGMIIHSLLHNTELTLPGRADFLRDFVHIDDVTRLSVRLVTDDLPGVTLLNAGTGVTTSLQALVALASEVTGVSMGENYREPGRGTLVNMQASMVEAERLLGYRPDIQLRDGINQTIDWFMSRHAGKNKAAEQ